MIKIVELEPDKCGACRKNFPVLQLRYGETSITAIRLCEPCRKDMIDLLQKHKPKQQDKPPGKDCSICECARCINPDCAPEGECQDLHNCERPMTDCEDFEPREIIQEGAGSSELLQTPKT